MLDDFWKFNFADVIGTFLSLITILFASRIKNAIMKNKVEDEIKNNITQMRRSINSIKTSLNEGNVSKYSIISDFGEIDSLLRDYTRYISIFIWLKALWLHLRYKVDVLSCKNDCVDENKEKILILMSDYSQFINSLNLKVGGKNNDKRN